jgi:hypothetical protein
VEKENHFKSKNGKCEMKTGNNPRFWCRVCDKRPLKGASFLLFRLDKIGFLYYIKYIKNKTADAEGGKSGYDQDQ